MPHPAVPSRPGSRRRELSVDEYVAGVLASDRSIIARCITLIESAAPRHQAIAQAVLGRLLPEVGRAQRVGITGVPGVGKSTFIEAFGQQLTAQGHRVAVLAIDPSSSRTGGSILGDKTRMEKLASDPNAFIRPSPSGCTLGGVARKTRETMFICEAAGFDVILIETVGVGQSETVVAEMVDFFLVLMLAGAGDELQGIKRGVLEIADLIAVNKADGDNRLPAQRARQDYANALHVIHRREDPWQPPARICSALTGDGLDELWQDVLAHRQCLRDHGLFDARRQEQQVRWMWSMIEERLLGSFRSHPQVAPQLAALETAVRQGGQTATAAADSLLRAFGVDQEPRG